MNTPLRVLIVEDSEDDALLVVRELEKGGYAVKFQRVDNSKEMSAALNKQTWDIVLSDYRMPNFSGSDALALLKQTGLDIPFIAISGKIGEETAVELMLAGADDYVMKTNLTRLAPAVRRELREAEVRKERKRAEEQIISHSKFASESPAPILRVSSDGIILNYNHASLPLLLDWQTEVGKPVPEKWGRLVSEVLKFGTGKTAEVTEKDNVYLLNVIPIKDNDYVNIYAADITDLKSAEVWVQHLNRVLLTIRKVNQLIVTLDDENELLQKICETLIDGQNYKLARIGFIKEGSYDIQPVAQAGFARDYLNSLKVTWDDSEYGRSPSGMAIKTGKPAIIQDVVADESFQLWRDIALKFGFASVAALPLKIRNKTIGVLVVYSDKKATFRDDEIELLKELAGDISLGIQKIRQQNEIKQVNEKYAAVVESSNDGIIILQDGIIKFTNANMGKMAGYTASENIGKPFIDFISTRYRESVMEIYRKIITSEAVSVRNEAEIITKDNKLLPVEVNSNTIQYEGRPAVMSIIRDITERKQADNNLKKSEYKFKELFNNISSCVAVYEVLNDGENFIFKDFNQAAEKTEGIRKEELVGKLVTDVFPGVVEMGLLTVLQRVWKTGKPEHYPVSSYQDQRISGWRENFVYRLPSGEIVSAYEDVTPRKQAEAAIRESEEKYRSLYENSYDAILLTIPDGSILSANPAACLMFGRSEQEICQVGRNGIIDVTDPRVAIALKERERTGKFEGELTFVRKDGTKFPGVLSSKVFYDFQGNPRTSMIIRDITERKQAEDKLRAIVVNAPLGIATSNTDRLFLSANEAFCKIVGYTEAELQQMSFKDITHPADIRESAANMDALDANKISVFNIEKRYLKKDGTVIFGRATVNAMRSPEGRPLLYIAELEDITERKQAEEELKESQLRLEEAHRLAHIGIWNWDAAQDTVTWSKELYEIAGLDPVLPAPTYAEHTKVYTPDSFTRLSKAVEEALQTGKVYELELELVRPDGTHRWVYAFGSPKYSVDGKILGLHGTVQDISERKKAEAEINFRAEMLNAATDSIIVLDEKGRIIYFNETSYSSLGYTREEMNGKKLRNLVTAEFFSKISSQINIMLEGKKEAVFEANMVRKDKSTFPVEIHGRMVTLDNRDYIINNIRDITRRKQLDTALRISEENFRNSIDNSPFGIRIITAEGRSLYCNKALSDMWGYSSKEEFEAAPPQERYTPEDYLAYLERVAQRQKGTFTITDYEVNIKRRDGPTRFLSVARKDTIWNGSPQYMLIYQDITEQRRLEKQQELSLKVLYLLNQSGKKKELIRNLLELFKTDGQYEAVGIRLNEGDDFPYYESNGFPDDHIRTENRLCVIDDKGNLLRDSQGAAILECMCGNIIRGRFDPSKPFFTEEGSFWTNSTTNLLSSTTEADRQARTRNRCNGEGYESVALIPLKAGNTIIGLLQINDTRRNCFTEELIKYYEGLARSIGVALAQKQAEDTLIDSEAKYHNLVERANDGICILQDMRIEFCNQHLAQMWGGSVDEIAGKPFVDFVHPDSLEKVVDNYKQRMAGKDVPSIYEVSLKRKNGS
ncbi:MAG: PAS domain S-box protein, partial [Dehalococcoidales bacterium]|nr:PAS domain S-box protein [Dehalococcoidales bacterium]